MGKPGGLGSQYKGPGYASEPTFSPPSRFCWTFGHTVVVIIVALAGLGYLLGTLHLSQAHDLPRPPREPAQYEITMFAGGGNAYLGVKATTMKIKDHNAEGGPLLLFRGTDGYEYTYHGPFLVKTLK